VQLQGEFFLQLFGAAFQVRSALVPKDLPLVQAAQVEQLVVKLSHGHQHAEHVPHRADDVGKFLLHSSHFYMKRAAASEG